MRWFTHKSVALAGAMWLGVPLPGVVGVAAGSILPDCLDMTIAGRDKSRFQRLHRGFTHWGGWYVLLLFLVPSLGGLPGVREIPAGFGLPDSAVADVLLGLGFGALSHVLLDALNPSGVPLLPWRKHPRLSLNMVVTGSFGEHVFLLVSLVLLGAQFPSLRHLVATLSS